MSVYDRNEGVPGKKPNFWIAYAVTEAQRVQFGLRERTVRERAGTARKSAEAMLAQRRRAVREGTWRPLKIGGSSDTVTVDAYVKQWNALRARNSVKSAHDEKQRLRDHVVPVIGHKLMREVTRRDLVQLIRGFMETPSKKTKELPAPRTVHRVYEDIRTMFAYALEVDEIIPATPCTLKVKRGELPEKEDADPRWRETAVYSRPEVETLISDEATFWPRRVTYGLMFLTGSRLGEVAGVRWRDYDPTLRPLGRLVIATQYEGARTKTRTTRTVPVHPVLAALLARWKLEGFPMFFGGPPRPDDFIVPRIRERGLKPFRGLPQYGSRVWGNLQADLKRHGFRARRTHDARRTLISLARADGANEGFLKWITHGPSKSKMLDVYTTPPWEKLCEQISCLRVELLKPDGATVTPIRASRD